MIKMKNKRIVALLTVFCMALAACSTRPEPVRNPEIEQSGLSQPESSSSPEDLPAELSSSGTSAGDKPLPIPDTVKEGAQAALELAGSIPAPASDASSVSSQPEPIPEPAANPAAEPPASQSPAPSTEISVASDSSSRTTAAGAVPDGGETAETGTHGEDPSVHNGENAQPDDAEQPEYNLSSTHFLADVETAFIDILNEKREEKGLGRLKYDATLASAARLRAIEQDRNDYFAHERPDGSPWYTVLEKDFPCSFKSKGENLASAAYTGDELAHQTAQEWYDQWAASPSHYENMFMPEFEYIGVGVYYSYNGARYNSIAATLFAAD